MEIFLIFGKKANQRSGFQSNYQILDVGIWRKTYFMISCYFLFDIYAVHGQDRQTDFQGKRSKSFSLKKEKKLLPVRKQHLYFR